VRGLLNFTTFAIKKGAGAVESVVARDRKNEEGRFRTLQGKKSERTPNESH
jgi:hypothetical protein